MESILLVSLLGIGYTLANSKEKEDVYIEPSLKPPVHEQSGNSIYNQTNYLDSKVIESQKVKENVDLSMKGDSKMIDRLNMQGRNTLRDDNNSRTNQISLLTGMPIPGDFLENEKKIAVEPFFGSTAPGVNLDDNRQFRRTMGGEHAFREQKKELGQFFELEKDYGNVFGVTFSGANADKSRYASSNLKQNELPFEQEYVPPIDDKSEINRDIGMIHAQRNSTDNRRVLNNQQKTFGGKVLSGKGIDNRGEIGEVFKHLPDADYENTADKWLITTGAIDAPSIYPEQVLKDTNRSYNNEGKLGPAGAVNFNPSQERPMFKKSTNQQLHIETNRNMNIENKATDDDHNKNSFFMYPNERQITSERTYEGNIKTEFVGETERLYDSVKPTIKQTTLDDSRNGFVGSSGTLVPTERLQDTIRPTVKQTTNYEYSGNAGSYLPGSMANDQYYRADLNPNKELISRGRSPVTEKTKLANGVDWINMDIQKIESDYFNPRIGNADNIFQEIPTDDTCEYTQEKDTLDNVKLSDRLDPSLLDPFRENPYTQSLASFA